MGYKDDIEFSKNCDIKLKNFWKAKAYEGRFVIVGSEFLQKKCGIDVILQKNEYMEVKIDTKHRRKFYESIFLEEMSCTVEGREKLGWILKEDGHPDYICYCFWKNENTHGYLIPFLQLRNWFKMNKNKYPLIVTKTINKTSGRIVPIKDIQQTINIHNFQIS